MYITVLSPTLFGHATLMLIISYYYLLLLVYNLPLIPGTSYKIVLFYSGIREYNIFINMQLKPNYA